MRRTDFLAVLVCLQHVLQFLDGLEVVANLEVVSALRLDSEFLGVVAALGGDVRGDLEFLVIREDSLKFLIDVDDLALEPVVVRDWIHSDIRMHVTMTQELRIVS